MSKFVVKNGTPSPQLLSERDKIATEILSTFKEVLVLVLVLLLLLVLLLVLLLLVLLVLVLVLVLVHHPPHLRAGVRPLGRHRHQGGGDEPLRGQVGWGLA